tara:strand:+ start:1467 stop:3143 length:1677 start_codon:yes stop_codon:yes gene_type:complete
MTPKKNTHGGARKGAGRPKKVVAQNNAYQAAESYQPGRTYMVLGGTDPRSEFGSASRTTIMKKARWLYANSGIAARAVDGIARYVTGTGIIPQMRSSDAEWNTQAEALFNSTVGTTSFAFDKSGSFNFYEAQAAIVRQVAIDGDHFGILQKSATGSAMMRFVSADRVGNGNSKPDEKWQDGVKTNADGRPIAFRVLTDAQGTSYRDIQADDVMHFWRPTRIGYTRAPSWLARAVLHLHDISDTVAFTKQTFKQASQTPYVIESPDAGAVGMGASLRRATSGCGDITLDQLVNGSGVMQLPPGSKLQAFKNDHPGQNFEGFMDFLVRDIAYGIGVSPEVLWNITDSGGANTRFVLADAQVFFEELQNWLVNQFCRRYVKFFLWQAMEKGDLPFRADWYNIEFVLPSRITVDFGRDTKALLSIVESGNMSARRFSEMHGIDQDAEDQTTVDTAVSRRAKCEAAGLNVDSVFPPPSGEPSAPTSMVDEQGEVVEVDGDIQATALNGAQITALSDLATAVTEGRLAKDSAKAMAAAAFPLLTQDQIDAIFDPLEVMPQDVSV